MKWFDNTALTLVIIGAVNWLLIGVFRFDAGGIYMREYELAFQDHLYASRFVRLILDQSFWQNQINVRIKEKHLVK